MKLLFILTVTGLEKSNDNDGEIQIKPLDKTIGNVIVLLLVSVKVIVEPLSIKPTGIEVPVLLANVKVSV